MRKIFFLFTVLSLIFSACSAPAWGVYATPTPDAALGVLSTLTLFPTFTPAPTFSPFTETPFPTQTPAPTVLGATVTPLAEVRTDLPQFIYYTQPGDYLPAIALRFGVDISYIRSPDGLNPAGLLPTNIPLIIPNVFGEISPSTIIMPDSEIIYSPSVADFNISEYVQSVGGKLATFKQYLGSTGITSGADSVQRISVDHSLNPRLILAILDYESKWVRSNPTNLAQEDYPLGYIHYYYKELYRQMMWAAEEISIGYYGWRAGTLTELTFADGKTMRLDPRLNAGTVAIQHFFSKTHKYSEWVQIVDPNVGFPKFYADMFGDPWERSAAIGSHLQTGLTQPELSLPFVPNRVWSYTGGPHAAWDRRGALAALDFAPALGTSGCGTSEAWLLAPAAGRVVRVDVGVVVLDLDGDGQEQTGWNLLFMHIATRDKAQLGQWLDKDDKIGHPSCEGGISTGTHVHIARKYNGEWILAEGPLPFDLSGWMAKNGNGLYEGSLTRGDQIIEACSCGSLVTNISRGRDE